MALNISSENGNHDNTDDLSELYHFGECVQVIDYTMGFAAAFVFTRFILLILYLLLWRYSDEIIYIEDYKFKIIPLLLSSFVMCFSFGNYPAIIIFPLTVFIETFSEIIIESFFTLVFKPDPKVYQERLGIFIM